MLDEDDEDRATDALVDVIWRILAQRRVGYALQVTEDEVDAIAAAYDAVMKARSK